jgi:hypothetical protein
LQRRHDIIAFDSGGITVRADQYKILIHHRIALDPETFRHELFLSRFGIDKHHIGVAMPRGVERPAGDSARLRNDVNLLSAGRIGNLAGIIDCGIFMNLTVRGSQIWDF